MEVSKFNFYSIGIVAKNKSLASMKVEVTPTEDLPMLNGEITDSATDTTATAVDAAGSTYSTKVTSSVTVEAEWLPLGSSGRLTSPDVRRGEVVMLYRFGDTDKFFWTTLKADSKLRRLETVVYGFSGNPAEGAAVSADNMYYMEVSTHNKVIHLHTSNKNGEPFVYDIQINAGEGYIQIQDDDENYIMLNSKDRQIVLSNGDSSSVSLDKKNISLVATETISLSAKTITTDGSESITLTSQSITNDGNTVTTKASSSFTVTSPNANLN